MIPFDPAALSVPFAYESSAAACPEPDSEADSFSDTETVAAEVETESVGERYCGVPADPDVEAAEED